MSSYRMGLGKKALLFFQKFARCQCELFFEILLLLINSTVSESFKFVFNVLQIVTVYFPSTCKTTFGKLDWKFYFFLFTNFCFAPLRVAWAVPSASVCVARDFCTTRQITTGKLFNWIYNTCSLQESNRRWVHSRNYSLAGPRSFSEKKILLGFRVLVGFGHQWSCFPATLSFSQESIGHVVAFRIHFQSCL